MNYILTKKFDGTFTMNWIGTELSNQLRDIKTFSINPVKSIKTITNFYDTVRGETAQHYFKKYFSFSNSRSGVTWSEPEPITGITGDYCPYNLLYLNLSYFRIDVDSSTTPVLSINNIVIEGTYDIEETDEIVTVPDDGYILTPKDIYKIFKLTGFELYGINTNNLSIKYRFTQDGGRTYTPWEFLTTENLSTVRLNNVRFAQVEYAITKIDPSIISKVYDIVLLGDFQNINNYYLKTNRYGVREDCSGPFLSGSTSGSTTGVNSICLSGKTSYKGDGSDTTYNYNRDWFTQGLSCYLTGNIYTNLNAQNNTDVAVAGNYDPYNTTKIAQWYNFLAGSTNKTLGWEIDYHLTDPDGKGIDKYLHEYQLFKIIVHENTFPDNQVVVNEWMLDMVDTFEVIILKDVFHAAFGIEKRPSQKDIIYFCRANRLYRVEHAQVKRDVMYMGMYYTVILKKYEKLANEQNISDASKSLIEPLTKNNTIDSLFGFDNRQEEEKIVTKQFKPTTHEVYRANINPKLEIVKKDIFNSLYGLKIADTYYNLSSLPKNISAVTYTIQDPILEVSENRAINLWLNFNNKYDPNKMIDQKVFNSYNVPNNVYYEFLNNYDQTLQKGYKVWYSNKQFGLTINDLNYYLNFTGLTTNIWYGLTVNIDNRQRVVSIELFKRDNEYNITLFTTNYESAIVSSTNSTGLTYYMSRGYKPIKNNEIATQTDKKLLSLASVNYENVSLNSFNIDKTITLPSSDIKMTNIRIFDDVIPNESKSNVLLQRISQDSDHLILADNASRELYTSNLKNTRWE